VTPDGGEIDIGLGHVVTNIISLECEQIEVTIGPNNLGMPVDHYRRFMPGPVTITCEGFFKGRPQDMTFDTGLKLRVYGKKYLVYPSFYEKVWPHENHYRWKGSGPEVFKWPSRSVSG
jgi:hypothetical protein